MLIPLADEYDPMFPNDYEKVVKKHREERQRQREQERQKEIEEREKYASMISRSFIQKMLSVFGKSVNCQPIWLPIFLMTDANILKSSLANIYDIRIFCLIINNTTMTITLIYIFSVRFTKIIQNTITNNFKCFSTKKERA